MTQRKKKNELDPNPQLEKETFAASCPKVCYADKVSFHCGCANVGTKLILCSMGLGLSLIHI